MSDDPDAIAFKGILRDYYDELLNEMVPDQLITLLFQHKLLNQPQLQMIQDASGWYKKNVLIIKIMLTRNSDDQRLFVWSLHDSNQGHIGKKLQGAWDEAIQANKIAQALNGPATSEYVHGAESYSTADEAGARGATSPEQSHLLGREQLEINIGDGNDGFRRSNASQNDTPIEIGEEDASSATSEEVSVPGRNARKILYWVKTKKRGFVRAAYSVLTVVFITASALLALYFAGHFDHVQHKSLDNHTLTVTGRLICTDDFNQAGGVSVLLGDNSSRISLNDTGSGSNKSYLAGECSGLDGSFRLVVHSTKPIVDPYLIIPHYCYEGDTPFQHRKLRYNLKDYMTDGQNVINVGDMDLAKLDSSFLLLKKPVLRCI